MKSVVVSIDFELRWGMLDRLQKDFESYRKNLLSVRENIPWILDTFRDRNISATWATVGALACDSWDDFDSFKPKLMPNYANSKLIYDNNFNEGLDPSGELYFANDLIRKIISTPFQELGLHTFGHVYGTESHVSYDEFVADIKANKNIFLKKFGVDATSLVYPRNQIIYENHLIKSGLIKTYRGNEDSSIYSVKNQREKRKINRFRALVEAINPHVSYVNTNSSHDFVNIKSSSMLRIHMGKFLRKLHLNKLMKNIDHMGDDTYFHIWFHPHNLGCSHNIKSDFQRFFDFLGELIIRGKIESENMNSMSLKMKVRS